MSESQSQTQPEPTTYKWVNRDEFPHNNIQQYGDQAAIRLTDESEEQNIAKLFHYVMKDSRVTLLHLDDQKKQMRLFNIPKYGSLLRATSYGLSYMNAYQNTRHRFIYMSDVSYNGAGKGLGFKIAAHTKLFDQDFSFNWGTLLKSRIDNAFVCNQHHVDFGITKRDFRWADTIRVAVGRQSRNNYLSFYDKEAQKSYKFGSNQPETELPKQSNVLGFVVSIKKSFLNLIGITGADVGNRSYFQQVSLKGQNNFLINDSLNFTLVGRAAKFWGKNIHKNEGILPSERRWIGFRTTNFTTIKAELAFTKFPYLHLLGWSPYLYGQAWAIFDGTQKKGFNTKVLGQYGIGFASKDKKYNFSFSLFNCSSDRSEGKFGPIKFSF